MVKLSRMALLLGPIDSTMGNSVLVIQICLKLGMVMKTEAAMMHRVRKKAFHVLPRYLPSIDHFGFDGNISRFFIINSFF